MEHQVLSRKFRKPVILKISDISANSRYVDVITEIGEPEIGNGYQKMNALSL